jgi:hypothetical protein
VASAADAVAVLQLPSDDFPTVTQLLHVPAGQHTMMFQTFLLAFLMLHT